MKGMSKNIDMRYTLMIVITLFAVIGVMMLDPIAQDLTYHEFNDQQSISGIPNFWNVVSNVPFFLVGIFGLYFVLASNKIKIITEIKIAYILFFSGVALVAFGSGYYHLSPNNETLVWDRLPMTFAFMALFSTIIAEFISLRVGKLLLWPFVIFGVFSVFYWNYTEINGAGDLRLYALVQFIPVVMIPIILYFFKSKFTYSSGYWYLIVAYMLAKIFEYLDSEIHNVLIIISGHSIKHVIAALGVYYLLKSYNLRKEIS